MRALLALLLLAAVLVAIAPRSGAQGPAGSASARATVLEGVQGVNSPSVRGANGTSPRASGSVGGNGVRIGSSTATVNTVKGGTDARASVLAEEVELLGGRVRASAVRQMVSSTGGERDAVGRVAGLQVDGRRYDDLSEPRTINVPGAGTLTINRGGTGLRLALTTGAGGLSAGTNVRIANVAINTRRAPRREPTPTPTPAATPAPRASSTPDPTTTPRQRPHRNQPAAPPKKRRPAPSVNTRLTRSGFAFPIYPPSAANFSDTFGAARAAPIGSHAGLDIFAPFGSPVVAVADGKLSKVGTLKLSGNRLWLTTDGGDAFFYAHLANFSDAAVSGRRVRAGEVIGFTGNTGDAEPTPPHVHLEIHPGGEEEPPVDPYPILRAWQKRTDVPAGAFLRRAADTTAEPGSLITVRDFIAE